MKKLYIKQKAFKITDHYPVLSEAGEEEYWVDQEFRLASNLVSVKSLRGRRNFRIERGLVLFLAKYDIFFEDGKYMEIQQDFTFFKKKLRMVSDDYELDINGDVFSLNFNVYSSGNLLAEIRKKVLAWGDTFEISIYDDQFEEEILAIFIAVDEIIDMGKKK